LKFSARRLIERITVAFVVCCLLLESYFSAFITLHHLISNHLTWQKIIML
jgi:hypothetical protein